MSQLLLRSLLSGAIATILYFVSAGFVDRFWSRGVNRSVFRHDVKLGLISLAFGSPVLQIFAWGAEKYHYGKLYSHFNGHGWLYWVISIPIYVMLWDAVFYVTHLILHWSYVYRNSHFRHHACRPPVAWSGIAIDPIETIFSGILPYTVPLFILPFHIYTVYALNIGLMFWATLVHSSLPWNGNAIFMGPRDHNLHHTFGLKNINFAAVFTFWDRMFGTLDRAQQPPWWGKKSWTPKVGVKREAA